MDWINNIQAIISLIVGFCGLVSAAITAYIAVKKVALANKGKSLNEIWSLIMKITDAAMTEVEQSKKDGDSKKQLVIDSVTAAAKEAGIDISTFMEQLSAYIDESIAFANKLNK